MAAVLLSGISEMPDEIQLEFNCPKCHLSGLTPEVGRDAAVLLSRSDVQLPCPRCGSVLQILDSTRDVKRKLRGPNKIVFDDSDHSLSQAVEEALNRLDQEKDQK